MMLLIVLCVLLCAGNLLQWWFLPWFMPPRAFTQVVWKRRCLRFRRFLDHRRGTDWLPETSEKEAAEELAWTTQILLFCPDLPDRRYRKSAVRLITGMAEVRDLIRASKDFVSRSAWIACIHERMLSLRSDFANLSLQVIDDVPSPKQGTSTPDTPMPSWWNKR